jgi:hypothetical protein
MESKVQKSLSKHPPNQIDTKLMTASPQKLNALELVRCLERAISEHKGNEKYAK